MKHLIVVLLGLALMGCSTPGKVASTGNSIRRINPPTLLDATGYGFSQVVIPEPGNRLAFISGQFSGNPRGVVRGKTVEAQMAFAFKNLEAAIAAAGGTPADVVQIRVLIVDHREEYLAPLSKHIIALFGDTLPASTLIPVPRLALDDMLFEIEAAISIPQ